MSKVHLDFVVSYNLSWKVHRQQLANDFFHKLITDPSKPQLNIEKAVKMHIESISIKHTDQVFLKTVNSVDEVSKLTKDLTVEIREKFRKERKRIAPIQNLGPYINLKKDNKIELLVKLQKDIDTLKHICANEYKTSQKIQKLIKELESKKKQLEDTKNEQEIEDIIASINQTIDEIKTIYAEKDKCLQSVEKSLQYNIHGETHEQPIEKSKEDTQVPLYSDDTQPVFYVEKNDVKQVDKKIEYVQQHDLKETFNLLPTSIRDKFKLTSTSQNDKSQITYYTLKQNKKYQNDKILIIDEPINEKKPKSPILSKSDVHTKKRITDNFIENHGTANDKIGTTKTQNLNLQFKSTQTTKKNDYKKCEVYDQEDAKVNQNQYIKEYPSTNNKDNNINLKRLSDETSNEDIFKALNPIIATDKDLQISQQKLHETYTQVFEKIRKLGYSEIEIPLPTVETCLATSFHNIPAWVEIAQNTAYITAYNALQNNNEPQINLVALKVVSSSTIYYFVESSARDSSRVTQSHESKREQDKDNHQDPNKQDQEQAEDQKQEEE